MTTEPHCIDHQLARYASDFHIDLASITTFEIDTFLSEFSTRLDQCPRPLMMCFRKPVCKCVANTACLCDDDRTNIIQEMTTHSGSNCRFTIHCQLNHKMTMPKHSKLRVFYLDQNDTEHVLLDIYPKKHYCWIYSKAGTTNPVRFDVKDCFLADNRVLDCVLDYMSFQGQGCAASC